MAINVIAPGLATTVQDLGRPGYYDIGIPMSGSMDRFALRCANLLVGNDEGAAVLEAAFLGPQLEFTADAMVAVTGAELPPKVDGAAGETWTAFPVRKAQTLSFDFLKKGARAYIAVSGGIDVPVVLGSRSTYPLGALGGHLGRKLEAGDQLPFGSAVRAVKEGTSIPPATRAATFSRTPGRLRRRPTASPIGFAEAGRWNSCLAPSRSVRAPTRPTLSMPPTPTDRSRCLAAPSRSCSIAMRCRAVAISCSAPSFPPIWT
jgi:biotin-dependent carboxylase-like uncharacterized protein